MEVAHAIPGDRIRFELTRKKRSPKKGRLLEVLAASPDRTEPRCAHARTCGGCCWQQMGYEAQLREKEARVRKIFGCDVLPIIGAEKISAIGTRWSSPSRKIGEGCAIWVS